MEEKNRSADSINYCVFYKRTNTLLKSFEGMPQAQIGKVLGLTQSTVSDILSYEKSHNPESEYKNRQPSANTLCKIATHFNVTTDYLLGLTDTRTTDKATKELCSTLGLSETAIDILLLSQNYTDTVKKIYTAYAQKFPSLNITEEDSVNDANRLSWVLKCAIDYLVDDFIETIPASIITPDEYRNLSFVELIYNFVDCIDAQRDGNYKFVYFTDTGEEKTNAIPITEGFIEGSTTYGKPTIRYENIKKLMVESSINDIIAKLHDIKSEALAYNESEREENAK